MAVGKFPNHINTISYIIIFLWCIYFFFYFSIFLWFIYFFSIFAYHIYGNFVDISITRETEIVDYKPSLNFYWGMYFFLESFMLWRPLLMIVLYHQIKTPISFWCRRGLNPRSLIQPSETLPVELTGTHYWGMYLISFNVL